MRQSKKIAFTGVISAMSITILLLTSIFPFATYALPALSGVLFAILVIEINVKYAMLSYIVTSILSAILVPDKEAYLVFVCLLGYYPILKSIIEQIKSKLISYFFKLLLFNTSIISMYLLLFVVFRFPILLMQDSNITAVSIAFLLILGNITFLMYDYALSQIITIYIKKFRKKLTSIM